MQYPVIDPVIVSLGGGLALRWYGLMYLLGFAAVWFLGKHRAKTDPGKWQAQEISDLVFYGAMGAVLGGRVGYVFFYNFDEFLKNLRVSPKFILYSIHNIRTCSKVSNRLHASII